MRFLTRPRYSSLLIPVLLMGGGCRPEAQDDSIRSVVQEVRAGVGEDETVTLGMDVLLTSSEGQGIPCGEGLVEVSVEVSRNGLEGPWVELDSGALSTRCEQTRAGDLALVVDNSGSVLEQLDTLREGARRAAERVTGDGGLVSLVRVSTEASVEAPLTSDPQALTDAVDDLFITNGWTALWDGVRMGNETLDPSRRFAVEQGAGDAAASLCASARKQGVVVFTDGKENNSAHQKLRNERYPGDGLDTTLEDLLTLHSAGARTPVYTIGLGEKIDAQALALLADDSGGRFLPIESLDQVDEALQMVSEYFSKAHRACTEIPSHLCGALDVRVTHQFTLSDQQEESVSLHRVNVPCDARARGRVATILLTLDAAETDEESVLKLVANTVNWVSPVDAPRVLFVLDDFHHGEFSHDTQQLYDLLALSGYAAEFMEEPETGVTLEDLQGMNVVWFSNPGYPIDDEQSFNALLQFSESGGGVVLQGDDMSYSFGKSFPTSPLTRLEHVDNGVKYCGVNIDNLSGGRYRSTFKTEPHPVIAGLEGTSLLYGDDIDSTLPLDERTEVLAWATADGVADCPEKPVVTVFDPGR